MVVVKEVRQGDETGRRRDMETRQKERDFGGRRSRSRRIGMGMETEGGEGGGRRRREARRM